MRAASRTEDPLSATWQPLRLRLLGPSIALIVAATMIPTGLRHPSFIHLSNSFDGPDIVNNLILYLPLGFALVGSSWRKAFLWGLLLATLAETLQLGYVDRIPSFIDIACNAAGAVLGYAGAGYCLRTRGYDFRWLRVPRWLAFTAIPFAILGTIMMLVHRPRADFSNWSPQARLMTGDEVTGRRPWKGSIAALQIYPFALGPAQIASLARSSPSSFPAGGLLPANLAIAPGAQTLLTSAQQQKFYEALVGQNRLTVLVWAQPETLAQRGPARIVTYSQGPFDRNFTLGQISSGLTFRLRTPVTGPNGTDPALLTGPVLLAHHTSFLAAVYDGRVSSLYVDGQLVAHTDLGLRRPHLPLRVLGWLPGSLPIRVIELAGTEMLCSSLLALGLLALPGVAQSRRMRFLLGALAGLAVGATIWGFAVSSWGLGSRILLECLLAGWMVAVSVQPETTAAKT